MAAIRYPNTSRPKLYSSVGIDRAREGWTIVFVGSQNVPLAKQELSYRQEKALSAADTCLADSDSSLHDSDHGNVRPSVLVNRCGPTGEIGGGNFK